jgi:hypothetical protein
MQNVPLQAVPYQKIKTTLDSQIVEIDIRQLRYGMFIYITVNSVLEIGAVVCQNLNRIIRSVYLNDGVGFAGDFVFNDTQGSSDPVYIGLGSRFQLLYLTQDELTVLGLAG